MTPKSRQKKERPDVTCVISCCLMGPIEDGDNPATRGSEQQAAADHAACCPVGSVLTHRTYSIAIRTTLMTLDRMLKMLKSWSLMGCLTGAWEFAP